MLNGARERESLAGLAMGQSLASGAGGRRTVACIVSAGTPKPWGAPPPRWSVDHTRAPRSLGHRGAHRQVARPPFAFQKNGKKCNFL